MTVWTYLVLDAGFFSDLRPHEVAENVVPRVAWAKAADAKRAAEEDWRDRQADHLEPGAVPHRGRWRRLKDWDLRDGSPAWVLRTPWEIDYLVYPMTIEQR